MTATTPLVVTRLYPTPTTTIDPLAAYNTLDRAALTERPYVLVNMVASLDGATAVDGVTETLSSPTDRAIFLHLRSLADGIVVASTVRAESYGPARLPPDVQAHRRQRGQHNQPPIIVITRSVDLDWTSPLFTDPDTRPIVVIPADTDPNKRRHAEHAAQVIAVGHGTVDLPAALHQLRATGIHLLLCEGGPHLNAELVAADTIDELCLTLTPTLISGPAPRGLLAPQQPGPPAPLRMAHILEHNNCLYLRYQRHT